VFTLAHRSIPALDLFPPVRFRCSGSRGDARLRGDGQMPAQGWVSYTLARLPEHLKPCPCDRQVRMGRARSPWLSGSGQSPASSPGARWPYPLQNLHHARFGGSGSARCANRVCSWVISCLRASSSVSWASMRSCSAVTRSPLSWPGNTVSSPIVILQANPCGVGCFLPLSSPLCSRRLTVCWLICSRSAASAIVTSMPSRVLGWPIRWLPAGYTVSGCLDSPAVVPSW